jgi:hypothetical protein
VDGRADGRQGAVVRFDPDEIDALAAAIAARLRPPSGPVATAGDQPEYVTRCAARRLFGLETKALLRAQRSGAIAAFRIGKATVYRRHDLRALVESSRVAPATAHPANDAEPGDAFERAMANARRRR